MQCPSQRKCGEKPQTAVFPGVNMEEISVEIFRSSGKSDQFQKNGTDETGKGEKHEQNIAFRR